MSYPGAMTAVFVLLGMILLVLLASDILTTVFHPEGRGGPINRVQNGLVWRIFRGVGVRRDGTVRWSVLAFCGPLLAVLTIVVWTVVLIGGFALIYYPFLHTRFAFPYGHSTTFWMEALYYSGYITSTLGSSEVIPLAPPLRLITALQAVVGFALFAMSVTYVLSVYQQLGRATALAIDIFGYFQKGTGRIIDDARRAGGVTFHQWVDGTTRELLRVTQAHSQYPIIGYFHSSDPKQALPLQLGNLLSLLRLIEHQHASENEEHPTIFALRTAVHSHISSMNRNVVPGRFEMKPHDSTPLSPEHKHERLLRYMLYHKLPTPEEIDRGPDSGGADEIS
ncbi:hypothetical protein BH23GEM6_BH23GEM6_24850 [soil metagenome]